MNSENSSSISTSTTTTTAKNPFADVPPNFLDAIHQFLLDHQDHLGDVNETRIKSSVADVYRFIIAVYVLLVVTGVLTNLAVLYHILRHRLYKDATYAFILNNVVSDVIKCVLVIPISLYVLLVQNWMLGELLCSFLPMLQDIPLHTTTLTFVLTAWDRYRYVRHPDKPRLPAFVCTIGTWLTALCLVLPYPIYIIYVDLGKYLAAFEGVGICIVNLSDDMQEYMRGIFLFVYVTPLATITYLYVKVSRELQTQQCNMGIMLFEAHRREPRSRTDSRSTTTNADMRTECDSLSQNSRGSYRNGRSSNYYRDGGARIRHEPQESELDIPKERRTQKYLIAMVGVYSICLCPLMVLRLARLALLETYENSAHFDITYCMFVWIAFVPTCTTPLLFASWQMSRPAKERLRGYFRFSNRKLRHSCSTVVVGAEEAPATSEADCRRQGSAMSRRCQEEGGDTSSKRDSSSS